MKRLTLMFLALFFLNCQSVHADYVGFFTQVDIQPNLGRIAINRGVVRTAKYVDWMHDNREQLWREGIFPDAEDGIIKVTRTIEMDGQEIVLRLSSNHSQGRRGPGTARSDNWLKITIDGVIQYDAPIGLIRSGGAEVIHVELLPADHMLYIRAASEVYEPEYQWSYNNDIHFWYDKEMGTEGAVCDTEFLWDHFGEEPETPEADVSDAAAPPSQ